MIILEGTDALIAVMDGAITTTAPTFSTSFAQIASTDLTTLVDASSEKGVFDGVTPIDLVAAPGGTNERDVKYIFIFNGDSVSVTITIRHEDRDIFKLTIAAGGSATYNAEHNFSVYNASGQLISVTTPLPHAADHENGGSDEISVLGLSGLLADDQNPVNHAADHVQGGSDEIDGDVLDIDFTPSNYTPDTTPGEVTDVNELSAHLAGVDNALGSAGGGGDIAVADAGFTALSDVIDIASLTLVDIFSASVAGVAVGDTIEIMVFGTILNNSGVARTYTTTFDFGGETLTIVDNQTTAASASNRAFREAKCNCGVGATDAVRLVGNIVRSAPVAIDTEVGLSPRGAWTNGTSDITGTITVRMRMLSNNASATQSFHLTGFRVRLIKQTP